jgi:hypothetical protein
VETPQNITDFTIIMESTEFHMGYSLKLYDLVQCVTSILNINLLHSSTKNPSLKNGGFLS